MRKMIYICDRCGKELEFGELVELKISKMLNRWMMRNSKYELCGDCVKEIKQFLKGEKEEE